MADDDPTRLHERDIVAWRRLRAGSYAEDADTQLRRGGSTTLAASFYDSASQILRGVFDPAPGTDTCPQDGADMAVVTWSTAATGEHDAVRCPECGHTVQR